METRIKYIGLIDKEGKQHGLGKYIQNETIKYGLWNFGKKQKFFDNEDDFLDNLGDNEEKCASFFKWDINKIKLKEGPISLCEGMNNLF